MNWKPITPERPAPLEDVLVSVREPTEDECLVYMAWRANNGDWMISGAEQALMLEPYAYCTVPLAAPLPTQLQEQAA